MADAANLIHLEKAAVPGTHALVIGIGKYPHLAGGQEQATFTDGMRQLSSPPVFAKWMIQDYNFPGKPLASLSLLLSEAVPQPFVNPRTGQSYDVVIADIDLYRFKMSWRCLTCEFIESFTRPGGTH